jgi:two-component sensor histidine kinase
MFTLQFQCPRTSGEIDSCANTRRKTRPISIRVRCPICDGLHEWQVVNGNLGTVPSVDHRSDGARLVDVQSALRASPGPGAEVIELREQLLDELNHRLKNNLQILHGILKTASGKTDNLEAREVLSDTGRRIGAMGAAQQIYYSVRNSTDVSAQEFLQAVCANARAFFSKDVSITCAATAGSLPKETAMPLALALNELLTNAVKYGADDRGQVVIDVGLSQQPGSHEFYVQDHGPGFDFEEDHGWSSGLGLVMTLAQRLKGAFAVERRSGARCTLRFPDR